MKRYWSLPIIWTAAFVAFLFFIVVSAHSAPPPGYTLLKADEFNYNGPPDPNLWYVRVETGQFVCHTAQNVHVDGSNLILDVLPNGPAVGCSRPYTGARMGTSDLVDGVEVPKFQFQYGYVEVRAKILANKCGSTFWADSTDVASSYAEIDIEECHGDPHQILAAVHPGPVNATNVVVAYYNSPVDLTADFHIYAMLWVKDDIQFFVDGNKFAEFTPANTGFAGPWNFNKPFFLILSAGFNSPGSGSGGSGYYDYVRVYHKGRPTKKAKIHIH